MQRPYRGAVGGLVGRRSAGLSLIELLAVMALMAAILALGTGLVEWTLPRWQLRRAAQEVATSLRAARATAIIEKTEIAVPFDQTGGRYTRVSNSAAGGVRSTVVTLPPGVRFWRPDGSSTVTLRPPGSSDTAAVFSSRGLLLADSAPGYVFLGNSRRGEAIRVAVNAVGIVSISNWENGTWH